MFCRQGEFASVLKGSSMDGGGRGGGTHGGRGKGGVWAQCGVVVLS